MYQLYLNQIKFPIYTRTKALQSRSSYTVRNTVQFNELFPIKPIQTLIDSIGPVHERRPRSGGKGFVQCGQGKRRVLQMRTSALFGAKDLGLYEIYSLSAQTRGLSQCGQGVGQFSQFCAGVFYGWPLMKRI